MILQLFWSYPDGIAPFPLPDMVIALLAMSALSYPKLTPIPEKVVIYLMMVIAWPILLPLKLLNLAPYISKREVLKKEFAEHQWIDLWTIENSNIGGPVPGFYMRSTSKKEHDERGKLLKKLEKEIDKGRIDIMKRNSYARYYYGDKKYSFIETVMLRF